MPREISAGAVVFRKAQTGYEFLLLHYSLGHWDFPKGNIEQGEDEEETVRREIAEETGITRIQFIRGFRETIKYFYRWKGQEIFKIVVFHLVKTNQKNVKLSFEHIGYEWVSFAESMKRLSFKNSKTVLEKAVKYLSGME